MKERKNYLDIARVVSMIAVVMVHVDAMSWYDAPYSWSPWFLLNIFDSLGRFSVPVFIMISGSLFLDPAREMPLGKLFKVYVLRIVTAFFFWSFLYAVITSGLLSSLLRGNVTGEVIGAFADDLFYGHYHMWYMFVILGLYIVTPVLRAVAANEKALKYFLTASLILGFALPTIQMIPALSVTARYTGRIDYVVVTGYAFYYLFGYYIGSREQSQKEVYLYTCAMIIGFAATLIISTTVCMSTQYPSTWMTDCLTLNVAVFGCGAFVFIKNICKNVNPEKKGMKIIRFLSKLSLGVYLAQDFGLILFKKIGLTPVIFNPLAAVPVITILNLIICITVTWIISKIPWFKKHVI